MNDLKETIKIALKNDPALSVLIKGGVHFMVAPGPGLPTFPCITFYEQSNSPALFGDGRELTSESVMIIDVWSMGDTSAIAAAVNTVMTGLYYTREFSADLYENDTKVYHKSMRYRNKSRRY